ncbi:MAG TPA: DUF5335 family protein [Terriglobales bacterium]|nr:DUF5335 family protein [Terriglobales bacterium]
MNKHEIPHHQWAPFLENFSLEHSGKMVSVKCRLPERGVIIEAESKRLEALIQESVQGFERIAIILGQSTELPQTHFVSCPKQIRLRVTLDGGEEGVEIEADDGRTVIVQISAMAKFEIEAA